jgi:hypothetical protein
VIVAGGHAQITVGVDTATHVGDGAHTVTYRAMDARGNHEAPRTLTFNIDTSGPVARVRGPQRVRRGRVAVLRYAVTDAAPSSGVQVVGITVTDGRRRVVKTLSRAVAGDGTGTVRFRCRLRRGLYRVTVRAADGAGNPQSVAGRSLLRVR